MQASHRKSASALRSISFFSAFRTLALGICLATSAAGAYNQAITHLCRPIPDSIRIDGVLDEPYWKGLDTLKLLRNNDPAGGKPSVETKVLTAWSATRLYVAYLVTSKNVKGTYTKRDDPLYDQDVVELFLDPDGDSKNYLELEWNCLNAVLDYSFTGPQMGVDKNWTAQGMQNAVTVRGTANKASDVDSGMVVEISIPWTVMQPWSKTALPPKAGDSLPLNFYRIDYPVNGSTELISWASTGVADFHRPDKFGALVFSNQPVTSLLRSDRVPSRWASLRAGAQGEASGSANARRADGRVVPWSGQKLWLFQVPARSGN